MIITYPPNTADSATLQANYTVKYIKPAYTIAYSDNHISSVVKQHGYCLYIDGRPCKHTHYMQYSISTFTDGLHQICITEFNEYGIEGTLYCKTVMK